MRNCYAYILYGIFCVFMHVINIVEYILNLLSHEENYITSIAFCCISTGVFMFPNQKAAEIAVHTVRNFLTKQIVK